MSNSNPDHRGTDDIVFIEDHLRVPENVPGNNNDSVPDFKAILAIEKKLSREVIQLIENALADGNATLTTLPLTGSTHLVEEKMECDGTAKNGITPSYTVKGLTYTDGKILARFCDAPKVIELRRQSFAENVRIENPTIVVVSEWNFGLKDGQMPGRQQVSDPFPSVPAPAQNTFRRSINHTIFTRDKKGFDDYLNYSVAKRLA